nr:MAG TPA: hypothetical protein [Caudoviricetes sp.]
MAVGCQKCLCVTFAESNKGTPLTRRKGVNE